MIKPISSHFDNREQYEPKIGAAFHEGKFTFDLIFNSRLPRHLRNRLKNNTFPLIFLRLLIYIYIIPYIQAHNVFELSLPNEVFTYVQPNLP